MKLNGHSVINPNVTVLTVLKFEIFNVNFSATPRSSHNVHPTAFSKYGGVGEHDETFANVCGRSIRTLSYLMVVRSNGGVSRYAADALFAEVIKEQGFKQTIFGTTVFY